MMFVSDKQSYWYFTNQVYVKLWWSLVMRAFNIRHHPCFLNTEIQLTLGVPGIKILCAMRRLSSTLFL